MSDQWTKTNFNVPSARRAWADMEDDEDRASGTTQSGDFWTPAASKAAELPKAAKPPQPKRPEPSPRPVTRTKFGNFSAQDRASGTTKSGDFWTPAARKAAEPPKAAKPPQPKRPKPPPRPVTPRTKARALVGTKLSEDQRARAAELIMKLEPFVQGREAASLHEIWSFLDVPKPAGNCFREGDSTDKSLRGKINQQRRLMHPDKNMHPEAEKTFKFLEQCRQRLTESCMRKDAGRNETTEEKTRREEEEIRQEAEKRKKQEEEWNARQEKIRQEEDEKWRQEEQKVTKTNFNVRSARRVWADRVDDEDNEADKAADKFPTFPTGVQETHDMGVPFKYGGEPRSSNLHRRVETATPSAKSLSTLRSPVVASYQCCLKPTKNGKLRAVNYWEAPVEESELTRREAIQILHPGDQDEEDRPSYGCIVNAFEFQGDDWMRDDKGWLPIKIGEDALFKLFPIGSR